ncbi:hypothetical protein NP493_491g01000 [Ridgeia piscesae]|uniref:Uncharacterized protein n=1 Tax=Ridgeia piscesae TaxID=27915 RepID=A0AAD9NQV3_RIDPI|nr:hypothetical protein NP493_491g01000 [Ridgeia piscesae]
MDLTSDPCDDFFEYACGGWNKKNVIRDDMPNYNTFSKLRDELQVKLRVLLETPVDPEEPKAITNAKNLFTSCQNMSLIESRGEQPLLDLLHQLGGWPVLDGASWNESRFSWVQLMADLRLLNNRVLLNQWISPDDKNSSVNVLQLDQTQLGMPGREYFLKERNAKPLMAYETFATDVAGMLGADAVTAKVNMKEMIDFEIRLANITIPDEQRRDSEQLYNKYTISELYTNITQGIDWSRYLSLLFANVSIVINETEPVVVYAPVYMRRLADLLKDTPKRTVANYMLWRFVMNRVGNLQQSFLDLRRRYNKALHGTHADRARWRVCVSYVNDNFGMAVGRMFVKDNFDIKAKINAEQMIDNIRESFNDLLSEVPWMDGKTREVARGKAYAITEKIGYPDYIMNNTLLDLDYEEIKTDPGMYFENVLNNLNVLTRNNLKNLKLPVDRTKWSTTPAVVNAFYSATKNQIMFPAGILQPPFYHESYPKSLNFGGIAMVIGHEITHGFDDKGRQFDLNGNLKQWWSDSVIEKFKQRAQCIIDQYSNYTVPEVNMNLNGGQTQGENIADNGGLKQAYRAYRKWVSRQPGEERLLPGISLSHNQLFFLNFAQIWCGTARPENYLQNIRSGRHSPGRFRVIGSLSNSLDFAAAYKCPEGSRMNPTHKCHVW